MMSTLNNVSNSPSSNTNDPSPQNPPSNQQEQQNLPTRSARDPITCHVLDTTTGLPAVSMVVNLKLVMSANDMEEPWRAVCTPPGSQTPRWPHFRAQTNVDGRIMQWEALGVLGIEEVLGNLKAKGERRSEWRLAFDTQGYFGEGRAFFPQVEVRFFVDSGEEGRHVHVPLLVGPFSYTTYRGS